MKFPATGEAGTAATDGTLRAEVRRLREENKRLLLEREILKKSDGLLREGAAVKFDCIHEHLRQFPVDLVCRVLEVSRSGYYAWQGRPPSETTLRQEALVAPRPSPGPPGEPRHLRLTARVLLSSWPVASIARRTRWPS